MKYAFYQLPRPIQDAIQAWEDKLSPEVDELDKGGKYDLSRWVGWMKKDGIWKDEFEPLIFAMVFGGTALIKLGV